MDAPDAVSGPINLGNPAEFTMIDLAELVIELTGSSSKIVRLPRPVDDPQRRRPDISKAKDQLGWRPCVEFHDGLQRTIAYFSDALDQESLTTGLLLNGRGAPLFATGEMPQALAASGATWGLARE
jgi:hypothetical protein